MKKQAGKNIAGRILYLRRRLSRVRLRCKSVIAVFRKTGKTGTLRQNAHIVRYEWPSDWTRR